MCLTRRQPPKRLNAVYTTRPKQTGFRKVGIAAVRFSVIRLMGARSASGLKRRIKKRRGEIQLCYLFPHEQTRTIFTITYMVKLKFDLLKAGYALQMKTANRQKMLRRSRLCWLFTMERKEVRIMTREEALKIAKPILFNTEMVRAIQDGRKTVTRRVIKPKYANTEIILKNGKAFETVGTPATTAEIKSPYEVGDILYVRETWGRMSANECDDIDCPQYCGDIGFCYKYKADGDDKSRISEGWFPQSICPKRRREFF